MSSKQHAVFAWAERKAGFADKLLNPRQSRSLVLSGSVIMLVGSGFVSLANFGYNISVAHLLGPERVQSCGGGGYAAHARLLHQSGVSACLRPNSSRAISRRAGAPPSTGR